MLEDAGFRGGGEQRGGERRAVLVVEDGEQGVYVHGAQGLGGRKGVCAVADIEVVVEEPDVGFYAGAAPA